MEQISEGGSFSLLRTGAMRNGALAFSAYMLLISINGVLEPEPTRRGYLTLFPPNVFPWFPPAVVWALNIAFWAYLIWFFISLIRVSRSGEERLIMVAVATSFGFGLLTNVANSAATAIAQYGGLGMWAIATAAAGRLVVAHADDPDSGAVAQPAIERGFTTTAALFVGETLLATAGAMLAVAIALRLLYPTAHVIVPSTNKDSFTALSFLPYFPLQIVAGFALGFLTALHFRSRTVMFVWIVPLVITMLYAGMYQPASVLQNRWVDVVSRIFGTSCRPPDCYDQAVVVAPLYASLAFSLGSWLRVRKTGNSPESHVLSR